MVSAMTSSLLLGGSVMSWQPIPAREAVRMPGVDQLVRGRCPPGQDAQPAERVDPLEGPQSLRRDARPAHPVEAVAPGDHVALDPLRPAGAVDVAHRRGVRGEVVHGHVVDLEVDGLARRQPGGDEVLDDLLLAVDGHRLAGEPGQIDAVVPAVEPERETLVPQPLTVQPVGDPEFAEEVDGAVLQQARPQPLLDVLPAAVLDDHRLDAPHGQQLRQHQPGRSRPHDGYLGPH